MALHRKLRVLSPRARQRPPGGRRFRRCTNAILPYPATPASSKRLLHGSRQHRVVGTKRGSPCESSTTFDPQLADSWHGTWTVWCSSRGTRPSAPATGDEQRGTIRTSHRELDDPPDTLSTWRNTPRRVRANA